MHFTVILDANVLVPVYLRDLLLQLAYGEVFRARWTPHVCDEVRRTLVGPRFSQPADRVDRLIKLMHENVLQPMVYGYEPLIDGLSLPDLDDRHVLAAAIASEADTVVTYNLKHFPDAALAEHGVAAIHPDEFLASQIALRPGAALKAAQTILDRMRSPKLRKAEILDRYRRLELVHTAEELEQLL